MNIAGDVDPAELDAMLVRFLGTAAPGGGRSRRSWTSRRST